MKNFKKVLSLALAVLMLVGSLVIVPTETKAAQTDHVEIYEIFGGGASGGGAYKYRYVVLYNPTNADVNLDGWSIQYAAAAADKAFNGVGNLSGTIQKGKYFLVQLSETNNENPGYPNGITPNCVVPSAVNASGSNGKLVLMKTTEKNTAGTVSGGNVVDYVAYGTGTPGEGGTSAPAPSKTTSIVRKEAGNDSNDNAANFKVNQTPDLSWYSGKLSTGVAEAPKDIELPSTATAKQIVDAAYEAMNDGVKLKGTWTLEGEVTKINTPYNADSKKITVTMVVDGMDDKPIQCYQLVDNTGVTGVSKIGVGDKIKVQGTLSYYSGNVQFSKECKLLSYKEGKVEDTLPPTATPEQIVNAAYKALADDKPMIGTYTLTGLVTKIDTKYSETNKNITVTIVVGDMSDKPIQCYRLTGKDVANIEAGDTITVKGMLDYYKKNNAVQFAQNSVCEKLVKGEKEDTLPADATAAEILNAAYSAMKNNTPMIGTYSLTGVISKIDTAYSKEYKNITVTIVVDGNKEQPMQCYRLTGTGVDTLAKGDTIKVSGVIGSYNGTVQFSEGCKLDKIVDKATTSDKNESTQKPAQKPNKYEQKFKAATLVGDFSKLKNCNLDTTKAWDVENTKNNMSYLGNGVYKIELTFDKTTEDITIEFKIAFNNSWDSTVFGAKSVATNTSTDKAAGNFKLTIPAGTEKITFVTSEKDEVVYDSISNQAKVTEYVDTISKMGDVNNTGIILVLGMGAALAVVSIFAKRKMA